jgi:hypothetical protein
LITRSGKDADGAFRRAQDKPASNNSNAHHSGCRKAGPRPRRQGRGNQPGRPRRTRRPGRRTSRRTPTCATAPRRPGGSSGWRRTCRTASGPRTSHRKPPANRAFPPPWRRFSTTSTLAPASWAAMAALAPAGPHPMTRTSTFTPSVFPAGQRRSRRVPLNGKDVVKATAGNVHFLV